jgi:putative serine/threonine protein kinase
LLKHEHVAVAELFGTDHSRILTYPKGSDEEVKGRVEELAEIGVTELCFEGSTLIDGIPILGKGCVGLVTQATLDGMPVALKIRRTDADRSSMLNEARLLRLANSVDVGPRLIAATRNFIAMQLIDGIPLFKWAEGSRPSRKSVKQVVAELLSACFRLDSIGLDHGELSHAPKNVVVNEFGRASIVDFETASTARRVANVTALLQYFLFGRISRSLQASKIFPDRRSIICALTKYKHQGSVESFQRLLDVLGLS